MLIIFQAQLAAHIGYAHFSGTHIIAASFSAAAVIILAGKIAAADITAVIFILAANMHGVRQGTY